MELKKVFKEILQVIKSEHSSVIFSNPPKFKSVLDSAVNGMSNLKEGEKKKILTLMNAAITDLHAYTKLESDHGASGVFSPMSMADQMIERGFDKEASTQLMESIYEVAGKHKGDIKAVPHIEAKIGDIIRFGPYYWRVLYVNKSEYDFSAIIISRDIIEQRPYHNRIADVTWEKSDLRKYLNETFLTSNFKENERRRIMDTTVRNRDNDIKYISEFRKEQGLPPTVSAGEDTVDKIFLLSIEEARNLMPGESKRAAKIDGHEAEWWLRTPGDCENCASHVYRDGFIRYSGGFVGYDYGVRPVLRLSLV